MPYQPIKDIPMENLKDKFIKIVLDALDTEITPQDNVPDEVACAEVVSTLIQKVFPDFPILPSTYELFSKLKLDKRFKATLTPERGCIVVSPRTASVYGHAGVFITDERIASNNSAGPLKGQFTGNFTWDTWIKEFIHKRGLRTFIFDIIE